MCKACTHAPGQEQVMTNSCAGVELSVRRALITVPSHGLKQEIHFSVQLCGS